MKKHILCCILLFALIISQALPLGALAQETAPSARQIEKEGGESYKDDHYIMVSKTIEGTEAENVFDITLQVVTKSSIEEQYVTQDTAVVIVMDISNTMRNMMSDGKSRYNGAMTAAEQFLTAFRDKSRAEPEADLRVGFVAFNTDAHKVFDLSECRNDTQLDALVKDMEDTTGKIINKEGYASSDTRYTNIEGGLAMAENLLGRVDFENEYIIFLSDGFPTTYIKSGTNGYVPKTTKGSYSNVNADGVFIDRKRSNWTIDYGTNYSDKGATRAQDAAARIKDGGTKIFSVGVGLGDMTIQQYIDALYVENEYGTTMAESEKSTIDCYASGSYVIGGANDTKAYKNWLKDKIGSGYYYDSNDTAALKNAFSSIFEEIKKFNREKIEASWAVTDPMGAEGSTFVEFISLYDREGDFAKNPNSLQGKLGCDENTGNPHENTVAVDNGVIRWNVWNSGYITRVTNNVTSYWYELKYRVRLENELESFVENRVLDTNGKTTLSYVHTVNEKFTEGDIDFPIPAVKGWLGEFSFTKLDGVTELPLSGAEFELSHRADCSVCAAMYPGGWDVDIAAMTAVSGSDGRVSFSAIPSGHEYTLKETKSPAGYLDSGRSWPVEVAYNVTCVNGEAGLETVGNYPPGAITVTKTISGELPGTGFGAGAFTIQLKNESGTVVGEASLPVAREDGDASWSYTFTNLPAGKYTLYESKCSTGKDGYVCYPEYVYPDSGCIELGWGESAKAKVENRYEYVPDTVTVKAVKSWHDENDRDGLRPESIDFTLTVGDKVVGTKTAAAENDFAVSFDYDARSYGENALISVYESGYTDKNGVKHQLKKGEDVPGYKAGIDYKESADEKSLDYSFKNSHLPETVSLKLEKKWTEEGAENKTPVTFRLLADGVEINSVTLDGSTGWAHSFTKDKDGEPLYKYAAGGVGQEIAYSIAEDSPGEFWTVEQAQAGDGTWVFTNDYHEPKPVEIELSAKKYFNRRSPLGSEYSFLLSDAEGNVLQRVRNKGENVSFEPLSLDAEGTYTFYISEEKGRDNTVKYDTARYTVTVEVTRERDYKAKVSVALGEKEHTGDIAFFNSTRTSPPTGDRSNIPLFAGLMLLSAAAAAVLIRYIKKKKL